LFVFVVVSVVFSVVMPPGDGTILVESFVVVVSCCLAIPYVMNRNQLTVATFL
jgi:hypothetical protein